MKRHLSFHHYSVQQIRHRPNEQDGIPENVSRPFIKNVEERTGASQVHSQTRRTCRTLRVRIQRRRSERRNERRGRDVVARGVSRHAQAKDGRRHQGSRVEPEKKSGRISESL